MQAMMMDRSLYGRGIAPCLSLLLLVLLLFQSIIEVTSGAIVTAVLTENGGATKNGGRGSSSSSSRRQCRATSPPPPLRVDNVGPPHRDRWEAASDLLRATAAARGRFDRRASSARLVGLFLADGNSENMPQQEQVDVLVAVQPDRSSCRKFIFLDAKGDMLGYMLIENPPHEEPAASPLLSSSLRGMWIDEALRGRGYSKLFLAIWLRLCLETGVVAPGTNRINKPLLALSLLKFGFEPVVPGDKRQLAVDVSAGPDGRVVLYSESSNAELRAGFTATELRCQRLVVVNEKPFASSRTVQIRTQYEFPHGLHGLREATASLLGGRLLLGATQDSVLSTPLTAAAYCDVVRALHGRLEASWGG